MEIKFRIWDFFNDQFWFSDRYAKLSTFFRVIDDLKSGGNKMGELEQYTNRKSKNGKEVYEGDILWTYPFDKYKEGFGGVVKNGNYKITMYGLPEEAGEDETITEIKLVGFHTCNRTINDEYYDKWDTLYLIGSVHDNPELVSWIKNEL